ncbi:winged helix-turn-helix transcriptional regulator [Agrobacterium tumefaciens]|uniref:winged helix-turn-helix transcriptional regulator n=1 Tax=Agrobacterium tumefaciens TaxID=358 RepID=UPI0022448932|nr:helix-turn-helix domain-containing protein [Agrobacterium tumefaciens]MCW8057274.1 helix-turn-helix transcriptional regulator [Agrobacterium tumefaciens]
MSKNGDFDLECPSRMLLDDIADKWSMFVLGALDGGPMRFSAIKRRLNGVSQKVLTQCLRNLERNGIVSRSVVTASPIAVEYEMSPLGRSLQEIFSALDTWTLEHRGEVESARAGFDGRAT